MGEFGIGEDSKSLMKQLTNLLAAEDTLDDEDLLKAM
jgi:hypothetical protein